MYIILSVKYENFKIATMNEVEYFFDNMCRLCIKKENPLFNAYEQDIDGVSLLEKMKEVCNIEITDEDNFPKTICNPCRSQLNNFYEFRNMCLSSERIFHKFTTFDEFENVNIDQEDSYEYLYYLELDYDEDNCEIETGLNFTEIEPLITVNYLKNTVGEDSIKVKNPEASNIEDEKNKEKYYKSETLKDNIEKENIISINDGLETNNCKLSNDNTKNRTRRKNRNIVNSVKFDPNKCHKCKVCKKLFSSELRVKLHMQRLHKQIYLSECKVVCPKCGMKFQHLKNLRRHLVYHNTDSYFQCSFCDIKLYSKKSFRKHIRIHDGVTNVICKVCNKHIVSKISYVYHMDYHRSKRVVNDKLFYSCQTCKIDFNLFEELEKHSLQNHCLNIPGEHDYLAGLNEKTLNHNNEYESTKINSNKISADSSYFVGNGACVNENSISANKIDVYNNILPEINLNNSEVRNENCEISKINDSTVNNGIKGEHFVPKSEYKLQNINASVTFMCNICCRVYKNLVDLKYHVTECANKLNQPKSFMCDICGKCFKSAWTLGTHKNGHSSDKPYICDICGQGFKWNNDLTNHKNRIHEKLRPYVCKICGKTCGTSATLKSHMRYHTGERPYNCVVCKATFTQNSSLKEHMYKHNGAEEGSCPICNKVFKTPLRLRTHIKRHNTQRKLYPCDLCGRMFTEKSSVRKHKHKIHTDMYQHSV